MAQRGAHVVVVHVLLDLVELPSVLLARGVSLREHSGEHGDEGTVKARTWLGLGLGLVLGLG